MEYISYLVPKTGHLYFRKEQWEQERQERYIVRRRRRQIFEWCCVCCFREFEQSTTYKSLTQPLKIPRLANPFPEPVKVMESHTLSDREKADIMMAEARQARQLQHHQHRLLGVQQSRKYSTFPYQEDFRREYSTKDEGSKCKKFTKCPKFNLKGCAPQGRKQCRLIPYPVSRLLFQLLLYTPLV